MVPGYTNSSARAYALAAALWVIAFCATAQQPFQYQYNMEADGLPYPEAFQVFFSRAGELWTTYGSSEYLSRFDGANWTHYSLSALGLPLSLLDSWEDDYGIWWISHAYDPPQALCYTQQGAWEAHQLDPKAKVRGIFLTDKREGTLLYPDSYFYRFDPIAKRFVRGARRPALELEPGQSLESGDVSLDGTPYIVTTYLSQGTRYIRYGPDFQSSIPIPPGYTLYPLVLRDGRVEAVQSRDGEWKWYQNGRTRPLQVTLPGGEWGEIVARVSLFPWNAHPTFSGLFVRSPADNRFHLYAIEGLDSLRLLMSHVPGNASRYFAQDPQGNWWAGTSTGVVRTNSKLLTFSESFPEMINGLHAIGEDAEGRIWLGGYNGLGGFSVFDGKELSRHHIGTTSFPVLPGALRSASGALYFFTEHTPNLARIQSGKLSRVPVAGRKENTPGYFFHPLSDGRIALGLTDIGLGIVEEKAGRLDNLRLISKDKGMGLVNVLTIAEDASGRLWLGRLSQGIALYDPQRDTAVTWLRSPDLAGSTGAISSLVDEQGTLWLGGHNGLYQLPQAHRFDYLQGSVFPHLHRVQLPGGDTSTVTILARTDDYIVIGTQQAVYFLDKQYRGTEPRIFALRFGRDIAGSGCEQNAVLTDSKGYLWIGTQEGATRIDLKQLRFDTSATTIRLTKFQAGDVLIPIGQDQLGKIPLRKRNIRFVFLPSGNPFLNDNLYFDIAVVNARGDTLFQRISTREREHQMDYLPHGHYTLHITADKHNIASGHTTICFTVPQQLDETPWFWLGLAALIMAIPFLWYRQRQREQSLLLQQQIAADQSQREQDSLKMQALSNFFNPHFINNALHWVQSRYRKDPETAMVIGKLADNVEVLYSNTQSGKAWHSLHQELMLVKNYLLIQQMRFGDALSIQLDLPDEARLQQCVPVPSLLLQIHTENAVEKGIRNRAGAGLFRLAVAHSPKGCNVIIEDDGQGRSNGEPNPDERKGSTTVMSELISLLNSYNAEPITVRYEDGIFTAENGMPCGTRVTIHLPKYYSYEFSQMENPGR
jgi:hypothetical protein